MLERITNSISFLLQVSVADGKSMQESCRHRIISACEAVADAPDLRKTGGSRSHRELLEQIRIAMSGTLIPSVSVKDRTVSFRRDVTVKSGKYVVEGETQVEYVDLRPRSILEAFASITPRKILKNEFPVDKKRYVGNIRSIRIQPQDHGDKPSVNLLVFPDGESLRRDLRAQSRKPGMHVRYPGDLRTIQIGLDDGETTVWHSYRRIGTMGDEFGEMMVWANFGGSGGDPPVRERRTRRIRERSNIPNGSDVVWR